MTPILVVDNGNRIIGRGHIKTGPGQASAHLTFNDSAWPTQEQQERAARTIAEININVRRRLEAVDRRRRRQVLLARAGQVLKAAGTVVGFVVLSWVVVLSVLELWLGSAL